MRMRFPLYLLECVKSSLGETGVRWDTFHFFSNIAENSLFTIEITN